MTKLLQENLNKIPTEHTEQVCLVSQFRKKYPNIRIIAIPNGGARNAATAAMLKAEGVTKGVPDLFIPEWKIWIELKRIKGGVVSPEQHDWIEYLNSHGYKAQVCYGADEAMRFAEEAMQNNGKVRE